MDRIEEIRKRVEAATPGPWEWDRDESQWKNWVHPSTLYGKDMQTDVICASDYHMEVREADHAFIQYAREDVPYLLDEVAKLRSLLVEVADWLCPHTEAVQNWKELKGARREWCCDCHNYLRTEEDATLPERLQAEIEAIGKRESS